MFRSGILRLCAGVAALTLIVAPLLVTSADAQRRGGPGGGGGISHGGGGGGFGGGRSAPMIHSAPIIRSAPVIRSAPMVHSAPLTPSTPSVRSFSGFRSAPTLTNPKGLSTQHSFRPGGITPRISGHSPPGVTIIGNRAVRGRIGGVPTQLNREVGNRNRNVINRNLVTRQIGNVGRASVLRNNTLASLTTRDPRTRVLALTTFQGRFTGQNHPYTGWAWRHRHPFTAVGWFGPLFWPYAYWDFVDYTFWPYAYDAFWPYAYDDIYVGLFGPYAYEGPAYASVPAAGRRARVTRAPGPTTAEVCSGQTPALLNWPIQQIADTVQPDQTQQAALNDVKDATAKALDALQSACPNELPNTPPGRLAAMRQRIEAMLQALNLVQPAQQRFYELLSDEQKARFNPINPEAQPTRTTRGTAPADLSQVCSGQAARGANVPIDRIVQALKPTDSQRSALDALNDATSKAADFLKASCSEDQTLTPPGRVAAMEQRLTAMLEAIKIVQPALESFYGLLTDEQKARFNQLGPRQS